MNPLKSRKQLWIAESELNRAQLVQELQMMADEAHALVNQVGTIGSLASTAASLAAGLVSFRHKKSAPAAEKSSWWRTMIKGAGLAALLWTEFRARPK
ncbi:MAG TPA: hypothetical protein VHY30_00150 [Verrucomicrobiae bacterium]|jgi:hypothetical protein|nr:hypothetical protein [Verrucomicrobiae bacterium]